MERFTYPKGVLVEFTNKDEFCDSWVLIPGTNLLNDYFLAFVYACTLIYMFLGIAIISDIFMGSIEEITS